MWGLASPPHPQGRTESCTLRILPDVLTGAHGKASGAVDFPALRARAHISAPDGAVDYVASPLWITHAGARCGFPSPAGSGAYIRTCGAVGVVGSGDDCLSLAYLRCSP